MKVYKTLNISSRRADWLHVEMKVHFALLSLVLD